MLVPAQNTYYAFRGAYNNQLVSRVLTTKHNIQAAKSGIDAFSVFIVSPVSGSTVAIQADNGGLWTVQSDKSVDAVTTDPSNQASQFTWVQQTSTSVAFKSISMSAYVKCSSDNGDLVVDASVDTTNPLVIFELIQLIPPLNLKVLG